MKRGLASPLVHLGLGDHAALAAPALERAPEVPEEACGLPSSGRPPARPELACDPGDEPFVAGEAENVVDAVVLAPRHQLLAGKAASRPAA